MRYMPVRRKSDGPYLGMIANFQGFTVVSDTLNPKPQGEVPGEEAIVYGF
jgi:hypothetical protein